MDSESGEKKRWKHNVNLKNATENVSNDIDLILLTREEP